MKRPDTSRWTPLPPTSTCDCYEVTPHLVVMVPHDKMRDTTETARENVQWQEDHWSKVGRRGCVAVFMDFIVDQEPGARDVYAHEANPTVLGYALIGGTFWGRAIASVYMGFKRPPRPTRLFATLDAAMPWVEALIRDHGADA
jgi:hypothetical protein